MEDVSKTDAYGPIGGATIQAKVGSDGVNLTVRRNSHQMEVILAPEQFDDFVNEVMRLIYVSSPPYYGFE